MNWQLITYKSFLPVQTNPTTSYYDGSNTHGFLYDGTTYSQLDYSGAINTYPHGMNDVGAIVGNYYDGSYRGFLYDGTTFSLLDYPGADETYANGINNAGVIVGWYYDGSTHGFSYDGTTYSQLDYPGAGSVARDINDDGVIVGNYYDGSQHSFLYDGTTFSLLDYPGAYGTRVYDINNAGVIVGNTLTSNGTSRGFIATPVVVPEPISSTLFIVGGATLGFKRLRKRVRG